VGPALALISLCAAASPAWLATWPQGPPLPGEAAPLHLHRLGVPVSTEVPTVELSDGARILGEVEAGPAGLSLRVAAPPQGGSFLALVEGNPLVLSSMSPTPSALSLQIRGEGEGRGSLVELRSSRSIAPADLEIQVAEGEVIELRQEGDRVLLRWDPGVVVFPHAVPLAVRDRRYPDESAAWVRIPVRARARIPVTTTPGSQVRLRVGGREAASAVAGPDGTIQLTLEVRPGEDRAELWVTDPAGNQQRSTLSLGGDRSPQLLVLAPPATLAGGRSRPAELLAVRPDGAPWTESAPLCTGGDPTPLPVSPVGPGRWRIGGLAIEALPEGARVRCVLAGHAASSPPLRPPIGMPSEVELRIDPAELDAGRPEAMVYASVLGPEGRVLPAAGLRVVAEKGALGLVSEGERLVLRYQGSAAVAAGGDTVEARWSRPVGEGSPVALELGGDWTSTFPILHARAVSADGLALAGVPLGVEVAGARVSATTDRDGWLRLPVPIPVDGPLRLEVSCAGLRGSLSLAAGQRLGVHPDFPERVAQMPLRIVAGRVARVTLNTEPREVPSGAPGRVRVRLRLADLSGQGVFDDSLEVFASEGQVSDLRRGEDGEVVAMLELPAEVEPGLVVVTARSGEGRFAETSTAVVILDQPDRASLGLHLGYLGGLGGVNSPFLSVEGELRLQPPRGPLHARLWAGAYAEEAHAVDPATFEEVAVRLDMVPLGLGLINRLDGGRVRSWVGVTGLVVPYRVEARFGAAGSAKGWGLAGPGLGAHTGIGLPLRGGEVGLQLSYIQVGMNAQDIGWSGTIGGVEVGATYRQALGRR